MEPVLQDTSYLTQFLSKAFTKDNIRHYKEAMQKCKQVDMSDREQFHYACGVASKTLKIKKGELILGKFHRESTINILLEGKIRLAGDGFQAVITAPQIFVSPAGTQKLGEALEDVLFVNIHTTQQVDPESIEEELICTTEEELSLPKPELPTTGIAPVDKETTKILLNHVILSNERDPEIIELAKQVVNGRGKT
jgi:hypothetical protein